VEKKGDHITLLALEPCQQRAHQNLYGITAQLYVTGPPMQFLDSARVSSLRLIALTSGELLHFALTLAPEFKVRSAFRDQLLCLL